MRRRVCHAGFISGRLEGRLLLVKVVPVKILPAKILPLPLFGHRDRAIVSCSPLVAVDHFPG